MLSKLADSICILINIVPFAGLCFYPFMEHLRISKKRLMLISFLFSFVAFSVSFILSPLTQITGQIVFFTTFLLCIPLFLLTVNISFSKLLFVFLVIANYAAIIVSTHDFLGVRFFGEPQDVQAYYTPPFIIIMPILFLVTSPFILFIIKKRIKPLLDLQNIKVWNTLWSIPLMFLLTFIIVKGTNKVDLLFSWQYMAVTASMAVGSFIVYYFVLKMLYETYENARLKENELMTQRQLVLQDDEYKSLCEHIEKTRAARHDLRHHLSAIETYLQSGNLSCLHEYLKEFRSSMPDDTELVLCENHAANVIVQHYTGLAKAEGVSVTIDLQLPQEILILGSDLCIILGNCLENALEACRRISNGGKFIHIRSKLHGNMLGITIDNSFDGTILQKNGAFFSHKRDNEEGIGLSSVRAVAAKYNGQAVFNFNNKEFHTSIILQGIK